MAGPVLQMPTGKPRTWGKSRKASRHTTHGAMSSTSRTHGKPHGRKARPCKVGVYPVTASYIWSEAGYIMCCRARAKSVPGTFRRRNRFSTTSKYMALSAIAYSNASAAASVLVASSKANAPTSVTQGRPQMCLVPELDPSCLLANALRMATERQCPQACHCSRRRATLPSNHEVSACQSDRRTVAEP